MATVVPSTLNTPNTKSKNSNSLFDWKRCVQFLVAVFFDAIGLCFFAKCGYLGTPAVGGNLIKSMLLQLGM